MFYRMSRQLKTLYFSSSAFQWLTRRITSSNFYHKALQKRIKRESGKDKKRPFNLVIETTNFCNAKCVMCPYLNMKRSRKVMAKRTFDKVVARIKKEKLPINKVFFSGLGEPLTDPHIIKRIEAIKKLGISVKLYTNASLLMPKISRQLVNLGLDEINISFNGTTSKRYQKVMSLNFVKTTRNIKTLLMTKKAKQSLLPKVQISLVITSGDKDEIKDHLRNWSSKVDSVTVSRVHEWGGGVEIGSKFKTQSAGREPEKTYPCRSLWHTFNIDSRGNFTICCRDYESKYILGNIHAHSFAEIQKSSVLKNFRSFNLKYSQRGLPKICQKCNFPYQEGVEWFLPRFID